MFLVSAALAGGIADCSRSYTASDLAEAIHDLELSFASMDAENLSISHERIRQIVPCVASPVPAHAVARLHRAEALFQFIAHDERREQAALAGMLAAEPGHEIPASLVPAGHPIRARLGGAAADAQDEAGTPLPDGVGRVTADGRVAPLAPDSRAALMQQLSAGGDVIATHYRWPDETAFTWLEIDPTPSGARGLGLGVVLGVPSEVRGDWAFRGAFRRVGIGAGIGFGYLETWGEGSLLGWWPGFVWLRTYGAVAPFHASRGWPAKFELEASLGAYQSIGVIVDGAHFGAGLSARWGPQRERWWVTAGAAWIGTSLVVGRGPNAAYTGNTIAPALGVGYRWP